MLRHLTLLVLLALFVGFIAGEESADAGPAKPVDISSKKDAEAKEVDDLQTDATSWGGYGRGWGGRGYGGWGGRRYGWGGSGYGGWGGRGYYGGYRRGWGRGYGGYGGYGGWGGNYWG